MDPILAAGRFPKLAERAMRFALVRALGGRRATARALVDDALIAFERAVQREATEGVRPAPLFAERDRIVSELRRFIESRLAARLFAVRSRDIVATGRACAPFDVVVRGRRGKLYAVAIRRLPSGTQRLEWLRRLHEAARLLKTHRLAGILVYDLTTARTRRITCETRMLSAA